MSKGISERLEQNKLQIIEMYQNNETMTTIGKKYNCNTGSVYYKLKEWKVETRKRKKFQGNIEDYEQQILEMYDNNMSLKSIERKFHMSYTTVEKVLSKHNRNTSRFNDVDPNNLLKDKTDQVLELYSQGLSTDKIGELLGHSGSCVWHLLQKHNIDTSLDTYDVDESFFETIDTEHKAYVLGMMYSDGNVMKDRLRISLQETDKHILEEIRTILKYEGPLYYKPPKNERSQAQWELCIGRKKMVDDLLKLGVMPSKSNILQFPTNEQVPSHLLWHFIRGVFDGDGGFSIKKNKYLTASFTACFAFNDKLEQILLESGIECKQYYRKSKRYTSQLMISKDLAARLLGDKLYESATIWLNRKRDKYAQKGV